MARRAIAPTCAGSAQGRNNFANINVGGFCSSLANGPHPQETTDLAHQEAASAAFSRQRSSGHAPALWRCRQSSLLERRGESQSRPHAQVAALASRLPPATLRDVG